jgi:predicted house-cleaning NTP pyrophosphatase (Maf/HAM1 superfamily)
MAKHYTIQQNLITIGIDMYVVKNSDGSIVAICSRLCDAKALQAASKLDKENYVIAEYNK